MTLNKLQKSLNIKGKIDYIKIMSKDDLKRQKRNDRKWKTFATCRINQVFISTQNKELLLKKKKKKTIYSNSKTCEGFFTTSQ